MHHGPTDGHSPIPRVDQGAGFNLSLFKRSGEIIPWGVPFDSAGLQLLDLFASLYRGRSAAIPGTFPSRVPQLLGRFDSESGEPVTADLKPLIEQEVRWTWDQLEGGDNPTRKDNEEQFFSLLGSYLDELIERNAPLRDVSNLFAIESFLKRQSS